MITSDTASPVRFGANTVEQQDIVIDALIRRLGRNLVEHDRLWQLLRAVESGYRFTNRLDEALVLVSDDVMVEIRAVLGLVEASTT